jgi:hypothetical protein
VQSKCYKNLVKLLTKNSWFLITLALSLQ